MMSVIAYGLILGIIGVGSKWIWDVWKDKFAGLLLKFATTVGMGVAMMILCATVAARFPVDTEKQEISPSEYTYAQSTQKTVYVYKNEHIAKSTAYLHNNAGDPTKVKVEITKWKNLLGEHFGTTMTVEKK